jgi:hypothetical protein
MIRLPNLEFRIEPLATLGESLGLFHRIVTASGTAGSRFDVGEYEIESYAVNEVDEAGRLRFSEVFASDHLLEATARLHARFAETAPDGPERTRAAGSARSLSAHQRLFDPEHVVANAYDPSFVNVDHRSLGTWSVEGPEEWLRHWRRQIELAAGLSRRDDDILAFTPAVTLSRHTVFGTSRASGGMFENVFLAVNVFGADGRYTRVEVFEPDQEAEALECFDRLVAGVGATGHAA